MIKAGFSLFYVQVSLLAVPVFLLVSTYLFFQKIENDTFKSMRKRCLRIAEVFLFWTVCQFAIYYGIAFFRYFHNGVSEFSTPLPIYRLLMEGGPPLPIVGGSVFYFLFALLIMVLVSTVFYLLRNFRKLFFLIGISTVIVSMLYFEILNLSGSGLPYWRIDNFLIYIPLAYFFLSQKSEKFARYIPYFFIGFILFSAQDVFLRYMRISCGSYSRVSIVFGSMAFFSSVLQLKHLNRNRAITFLSKYSLGIFAVHKYWQLITNVVFLYLGFSIPVYAAGFPLDLRALAIAVISAVLTFSAIMIGDHTLIKRYIS